MQHLVQLDPLLLRVLRPLLYLLLRDLRPFLRLLLRDYDNIFSEYVIPFLIPIEVNIVLIGLTNTGKTSFIKSLGGELKENNIDYSLYEIYIHDMLINMYEFSSKNMYKNMTKKYDNIDVTTIVR